MWWPHFTLWFCSWSAKGPSGFDPETINLATLVLAACRARGWHLATAEPCAGGLVAAALTAIAGSSDVVDCGFVTYSSAAKMELLGVPETILAGPRWRQRRKTGRAVFLGIAAAGAGRTKRPCLPGRSR
jgi:nicotinamide-nucleotide amidase